MADLSVTITESVTLNSKARGNTISKTFAGINNTIEKLVTCLANNDTTILKCGPTGHTSDAEVHVDDIRYIRVTNLATDAAHVVNLSLQIDDTEHASDASTAEDTANFLLGAGESFILGTVADGLNVEEGATTPVDAGASLNDLESIIINEAAGNNVQIEMFVATV
tara:strand:- start:523 stop:1020 length:498 start_codon:yes stop_codon:yes gene_type:complete